MQESAVEEIPLQMKQFSERSMLMLAALVSFLFVFSYTTWKSGTTEVTPVLDQIMEVKVNLMSGHLLYEEMRQGMVEEDYAQVLQSIEKVHQLVEASSKGGGQNISSSKDELLLAQFTLLHDAMHLLLDSQREQGLLPEHDQLFKDAMSAAETADLRIHYLIDEQFGQQQWLFTFALLAWFLVMAFLVWRWRKASLNFATVSERLNKMSHAVEQTGESMLISDRHGCIEYVNSAFTKVTGYDSEDVLGKSPSLLSSGLQDNGFYQGMWQRILDGKVWRGEVVDKRKDGSLYRAEMSISPIFDASCKVSHFVAVQRDITELREAQENLMQAKKMEAVGTMCCGLAHDMNNTLSVVIGNLEMLNLDEALSEEARELVGQAETAGLFAATMMKDLLEFSSKDQVVLKYLNLHEVVTETIRFLRPTCQSIAFDIKEEASQHWILGDSKKLHRVVVNLIRNACDAMEDTVSPKVTIRFDGVSSTKAEHIRKEHGLTAKGWLCLSISDNGMGIPEHLLEKVFDPFFTTKEVGKGTGLGLSSVYGIVHSHHGFIEVESRESQGTTFRLYFPNTDYALN